MPLPPIVLDYDRGVPVYRQVFDAIAASLARGDIAPDERLPTIHELARALEVNPNTVARAYRELEHAKLLVCERGRGTFPAKRQPQPTGKERSTLLRNIVDKALAECAVHGIDSSALAAYVKKELP